MRRDNNRILHTKQKCNGRKFRNNVMLLISSTFQQHFLVLQIFYHIKTLTLYDATCKRGDMVPR